MLKIFFLRKTFSIKSKPIKNYNWVLNVKSIVLLPEVVQNYRFLFFFRLEENGTQRSSSFDRLTI